MSPEELERDTYALGPLEMIGSHEDGSRIIERYRFEPQEHRVSNGDKPLDPEADLRWAPVAGRGDRPRLGARRDHPVAYALVRPSAVRFAFLIPSTPMQTDAQEESLLDLGRWVVANGPDARGGSRAGRDLLMRLPPRLNGGTGCAFRGLGETASQAAIRLILDLNGGCLPVQGPPGAGKTHMAALAALTLIKNLADRSASPPSRTTRFARCWRRSRSSRRRSASACACSIARATEPRPQPSRSHEAMRRWRRRSPTEPSTWSVARHGCSRVRSLRGSFDTLIVDEAGQMSLADALAVSRAARNLVLVGDPRQLAQPLQGSHPPGVGVSALEHLLGGDVTIAPDRGVLLDLTWRMHPDVTRSSHAPSTRAGWALRPQCASQAVLIDAVSRRPALRTHSSSIPVTASDPTPRRSACARSSTS